MCIPNDQVLNTNRYPTHNDKFCGLIINYAKRTYPDTRHGGKVSMDEMGQKDNEKGESGWLRRLRFTGGVFLFVREGALFYGAGVGRRDGECVVSTGGMWNAEWWNE
jgi:hypothetical protein